MKRLNSATTRKFGSPGPHGASRCGVKRRSVKRRGAVLVEAAAATIFIVLPLLLGIIQFGIYYSASNGVTQAAREGARWAAVYGMRADLIDRGIPASQGDPGRPAIPDKFTKDHIIESARAGSVKLTYDDITLTPAEGASARKQYTPVTVSVTYNMNAKRILKIYSPGNITRTAQSMLE